jgi:hypothetical protein
LLKIRVDILFNQYQLLILKMMIIKENIKKLVIIKKINYLNAEKPYLGHL